MVSALDPTIGSLSSRFGPRLEEQAETQKKGCLFLTRHRISCFDIGRGDTSASAHSSRQID
jgi:hypothetical protein